MSERQDDDNQTPSGDGEAGSEPDLRSILRGETARRRVVQQDPGPAPRTGDQVEPRIARDEEVAPPYEPPVRDGDEVRPRREIGPPTEEHDSPGDQQKLPPVWPGDEKQPWFRRERGLPPLPEDSKGGESAILDPEDLPTPLAEIPQRGRAWGVSFLLPNLLGLIPTVGIIFGTVFLVANLFLFRQGQDIGAVIFKLRVVRENGDVAGFFQMFVRNAASTISFLMLGAGYWSAFSDPQRRTWHDKWLKTYVVKDSAEYNTRKRSSSDVAFNWFWIIVLLLIAAVILVWLSGPVPTDTTPVDGGGSG